MKLKAKDDIIYRLMLSLKRDTDFIASNNASAERSFLINKGWIDALEWVLSIKEENQSNEVHYSKQEITYAIDMAIGDDGNRSKEVIAILEKEGK